jgi:inner membrane protein
MDSITQMLFGATVAQAGFRRRLGRKALIVGAVIASIPDFDVVAAWIGGRFAEWEHHRGLTHSLFFGPVVGPLIGWLIWRFERWRAGIQPDDRDRLRAWIWLSILALVTHPLIDLFTSYGTQLLWPVATTRFAIDSMPIIEPVYSAALVIALIIGSRSRVRPASAQDAAGVALLFIVLYSFGGWALNQRIERVAAADFGRTAQVSAYPLLFQPYYRRVVAITPEAAHVGYHSVLNPKPIAWQTYPIDTSEAVAAIRRTREAGIFEWFSMNKVLWRTTPDGHGGTRVEATDLRYGMIGPTDAGQWGIRAVVDSSNTVNGAIQPFNVPRDASGAALRRYWADVTGW